MRNSDFGGRSYLPPGNGPLNYGFTVMICFACLPVILCQVGGRPNVWHELKHCKTEREIGSYLVFSICARRATGPELTIRKMRKF